MTDVRLTLSNGQTIVGTKNVRLVVEPSPIDQSAGANAFRARNRSKTFTSYTFNLPYATSLAGAGRWLEPTKLDTLPSDPFDGRKTGHIAHQTSGPYTGSEAGWRAGDGIGKTPFNWFDRGAIESEDCCWITIDTPLPMKGANLPVRVHFHDGGNTQNPRDLPRMRGDALPIVSVSVEYPLSTFGFFTHTAFGEDHQINCAYACALVALAWVQDHIADYGGNPNCVSIEGGSAGGQMCSLLMPHYSGLFHRSASHSGGGAGYRAQRSVVQARGDDFWRRLIKARPGFDDPSRTIQQIADEDGIAVALRLGPSPEQILAFANQRTVYEFAGGGYTTSIAPDVNIWPAQDGVIIQHRSAIASAIADWPRSVPYMAGYVSNEAGLIDNARGTSGSVTDAWFATLGITSEVDKAAAIELLDRPGDRWQRRLYGMLYGYGAERLCREHSAAGGSAYYYYFDYDSAANGRDKPSHTNQHAYFLGKPEWQLAQGQSAESLLVYEGDLRLSYYLSRAFVNFCANGDPNDPYVTALTPDYYDDDDLSMFEEWAEFGGTARNCNVITNAYAEVHGSMMEVQQDHERPFFDFVDARYSPS